jgi:hypothetical protein
MEVGANDESFSTDPYNFIFGWWPGARDNSALDW